MERAKRNAGGKAALAGLLTGLTAGGLGACATIQQPPGGPPDFAPPVVLEITPDSNATVPEFDGDVEIQFDEIVTELNLDRYFKVSPRHEELQVSWHRSRVTVKPRDGWHPGARGGVEWQNFIDPDRQDDTIVQLQVAYGF